MSTRIKSTQLVNKEMPIKLHDDLKIAMASQMLREMKLEDLELLFRFKVTDYQGLEDRYKDCILFECDLIYSLEQLKEIKQLTQKD